MRFDLNSRKSSIKSPKYTIIDDIMEGPYNQPFNEYNSNATTGVSLPGDKVKRANYVPQDYLQSIRTNYPPVTPQRTTNLDEVVKTDQRMNLPAVGVSQYNPYPAGVSPAMKDLGKESEQIQMRESFSQMSNGQTCVDTLNHVTNCPLCSTYFKCDTKVYNVIILMLIIMFAIIMFFMYKEDSK